MFWFTTHYPHYPDDEAEWYIYVPRGFEHLVTQFKEGHGVAFYEVQKGKDRVGKQRKRPTGRQAVICLATASGPPRPTTFQEQYVSGEKTDFVLECPCTQQEFGHRLSRELICDALHFSPNYTFFGFAGGAGFQAVEPAAFERIEREFRMAPSN